MTIPSTLSDDNNSLLGLCLAACGQNSQGTQTDKIQTTTIDNSLLTQSKTAVITFDQKGNYPFNNLYKSASLTPNEFKRLTAYLLNVSTLSF